MTSSALGTEERAALQRRILRVLAVGQVIGAAALASAVTIGAFVVQDILGDDTPWGGIAIASFTTGTAFMSQVLARHMSKRGRRAGLQLGYLLAACGGLVAGIGVERGWLPVFLIGLFVYGNGQSANLLARYAATDLAEEEHRGRAMSTVLFASTFGAVLGPMLVGPAERAGEVWFGLNTYTGPWLAGSAFLFLAMLNTAVRLRPDPLLVARAALGVEIDDGRPTMRAGIAAILRSPQARIALMAMVVAQGAMVGVMTMTPVHLRVHGHESVSQYVVSLHIAGMYAFSPLVGAFSDRHGRVPTIAVGGLALVGATGLAGLSGDVEQLLFPSLWALGIGWNFALIGGSSLLSESVDPGVRVMAQGSADLLMSLCGGAAGLSAGFVRQAFGYHVLASGALLAALVMLIVASRVREPGPPKTAAALP